MGKHHATVPSLLEASRRPRSERTEGDGGTGSKDTIKEAELQSVTNATPSTERLPILYNLFCNAEVVLAHLDPGM